MIHEKHIAQLYGTYIAYCIENKVSMDSVKPVFFTSTVLSDMAKEFCNKLDISYKENFPISVFPRIKCNIGKNGEKIYHLPMDQQYDTTKINKSGEFMALTVK